MCQEGAIFCENMRPERPQRQSAFAEVRDRSVGRWRRDLTPEQLGEVESEAGVLLDELGYT